MQTIGEIVSLDGKAQFRNDVQLDAYETAAKNIPLLHSYLFSTTTPNNSQSALRSISSLGLLEEITNAFLSERLENRLAVVANFGHGKSHLALALANYFGKPVDSEETRIVLDKISHTVRDDAKAARFRDFKESRGEFLVIRLRGDIPQSLPSQFLLGLEKALQEHEATQGERLPFWYAEAGRILAGLNDTQRAAADAYLQQHQKDMALLLAEIRDRKEVYDEAVGAITAAMNMKPDLNEVSLSQTVEWAAQKFTGPGNPLGGILILFDEFSLYISKYAQRHASAHLQDLLNGVEKTQSKVVLLAFAQFDPLTTAENVQLSANERDDLKKTLTRLPRKYALYSLMESVIDAYLKQEPSAWEKFTSPANVKGPLYQATQIAWDRLRNRYNRDLGWEFETFRETVTDGAFPLHPITTAMLCNVSLGAVPEGGVPRTVLGFVMEQLQAKENEPAIENNRPNWVLPVTLVDYFDNRLDGDVYKSYLNALRTAGADTTPEQETVLKALLMQELANVQARAEDQFEFLWHSSGLGKREAGEALQTLVQNNSIRKDPVKKTYGLWPVTADPQKLEKTLQAKLDKLIFNEAALKELNTLLCSSELKGVEFGSLPMDVEWGHQDDWAAAEKIISADALTKDHLRSLVQRTSYARNGAVQEGDRGYIFWLLARNEDELNTIRNSADSVLDDALNGKSPHPVVMILPDAPQPDLVELFQRWRALKSLGNTERQDIGQDMYLHELNRVEQELTKALAALRGDPQYPFERTRNVSAYVVPKVYRGAVSSLGETDVKNLLEKLYRVAYRWRPPEFDKRYKAASGTKLRNATKTVAGSLLQNSPQALKVTTRTDPVARDLRDKFLKQKWGVLDPTFRIQKPGVRGLKDGWDYLESTFAAGETDVRLDDVLITLLNPPYGFDYNTAALLFSAWFGYSALDLQVSQLGKLITHDELGHSLDKGAKDFVSQARSNALALSRRDRTTVEKEIRILIDRARKSDYTFSQSEAEHDIAELNTFAEDERAAPDLRDAAKRCAADLTAALEAARTYDKKAVELEKASLKNNSLPTQLQLYGQLDSLPRPGNVAISAPPIDKLRSDLVDTIERVVETAIERDSQLKSLEKYQLKHELLLTNKKHLEEAKLKHLTGKVDQALRDLEERRNALQRAVSEAPVHTEINSMRRDASLVALYDFQKRLESFEGYSEETLAIRDKKLEEIESEISQVESAITTLSEQVQSCVDHKTLRGLHNTTMRIANRYEGSSYGSNVESLIAQIDVLGKYLAAVESIRQTTITTPESASKALQRLEAIGAEQTHGLSEQQIALLLEARKEIEAQLAAQQQEASAWLQRVEATAHRGQELPRLVIALQSPPPFLSTSEKARLQVLASQVEEQLAQDRIMQIEKEFYELPDQATRQKCLERLQHIFSENGQVQ